MVNAREIFEMVLPVDEETRGAGGTVLMLAANRPTLLDLQDLIVDLSVSVVNQQLTGSGQTALHGAASTMISAWG